MSEFVLDRRKLRDDLSKLEREYLLMMLDQAFEALSDARVAEVLADFVRVDRFVAEDGPRPGLVVEAQAFHAAALAGRHYEDFMVNSRNHMSKSEGTQAFIAEFHRLGRLAIAASGRGEDAAAGQTLDLLLDLHRQIDRVERDIVFFADRAGAWQIGVHWPTFLPAWCRRVAARSTPEAHAETTRAAIAEFVSDYQATGIREAARAVAHEGFGDSGGELG